MEKFVVIRIISKMIMRVCGGLIVKRTRFSPIIESVADKLIESSTSKNQIFEIDGFKVIRGRTTRHLFLVGESHEPHVTKLIEKTVKKGNIVFDLGANIGWHTLRFSKMVGKEGHVYAFEPDPTTFEVLKKNMELNNIDNVSIFQQAVSDSIGTTTLHICESQDGSTTIMDVTKNPNFTQEAIVNVTTLDTFCQDHGIIPNFIKMDIEGAELKAINGMTNILNSSLDLKIIMEIQPVFRLKKLAEIFENNNMIINKIDKNGDHHFVKNKELFDGKNILDVFISKNNTSK